MFFFGMEAFSLARRPIPPILSSLAGPAAGPDYGGNRKRGGKFFIILDKKYSIGLKGMSY